MIARTPDIHEIKQYSTPPVGNLLYGLLYTSLQMGIVSPPPPMSTSDTIHIIGFPRPSLFSFAALPLLCIILNKSQRTKNWGGLQLHVLK